MTTLRGRSPKDTFPELLKLRTGEPTTTLSTVETGEGTALPLRLSTTTIELNGVSWPTTGNAAGKVLTLDADGVTASWQESKGGSGGDTGPVTTNGIPYDIYASIVGKPETLEVVMRMVVGRAFTLESITGKAQTAPTGNHVFQFFKNNMSSSVGNVTFANGSLTSTSASNLTNMSLVVGDVIMFRSTAAVNATLSDIDFFFKGKL